MILISRYYNILQPFEVNVKHNVKIKIITLVYNLKELHAINVIISAFVHLTVEKKQTVASIDLFRCIQLLLDQHCELFVPNDNKRDISWENHQQETGIIAINCKHILFINILSYYKV